MGAIKGFVEFLIKEIPGPINESQKKMLTSMDRASFRLLGMINNILDIAKMEAGKMDLRLSTLNLTEIGERVIELMKSMGQRKNIKFILEAKAAVTVTADSLMMERMFTNLIGKRYKIFSGRRLDYTGDRRWGGADHGVRPGYRGWYPARVS